MADGRMKGGEDGTKNMYHIDSLQDPVEESEHFWENEVDDSHEEVGLMYHPTDAQEAQTVGLMYHPTDTQEALEECNSGGKNKSLLESACIHTKHVRTKTVDNGNVVLNSL